MLPAVVGAVVKSKGKIKLRPLEDSVVRFVWVPLKEIALFPLGNIKQVLGTDVYNVRRGSKNGSNQVDEMRHAYIVVPTVVPFECQPSGEAVRSSGSTRIWKPSVGTSWLMGTTRY